MKIDSYRFGLMVIGGVEHRHDVIVFHDRVHSGWWRADGHSLRKDDLKEILKAAPSTIILGRGAVGMLRVPAETRKLIDERGIRLVALRTGAAVEEYNLHAGDPGVVGAFHLTC